MAEFTLTAEERAEVEQTIREVMEVAGNYAERKRSSMPIYISDAVLLAGVAAAALEQLPEGGEGR